MGDLENCPRRPERMATSSPRPGDLDIIAGTTRMGVNARRGSASVWKPCGVWARYSPVAVGGSRRPGSCAPCQSASASRQGRRGAAGHGPAPDHPVEIKAAGTRGRAAHGSNNRSPDRDRAQPGADRTGAVSAAFGDGTSAGPSHSPAANILGMQHQNHPVDAGMGREGRHRARQRGFGPTSLPLLGPSPPHGCQRPAATMMAAIDMAPWYPRPRPGGRSVDLPKI